jgi:hypothetical protein
MSVFAQASLLSTRTTPIDHPFSVSKVTTEGEQRVVDQGGDIGQIGHLYVGIGTVID